MTISTVTSESLQLKIRQLLPSQQGFGTDLSASDTIIPVIDLTAAAEGSDVPQYLQTALAFGSQTPFDLTSSGTISTQTGFIRLTGVATATHDLAITTAGIALTDGTTTKQIWAIDLPVRNGDGVAVSAFDFTLFIDSGISVTGIIANKATIVGSVRQVADSNGLLVQPSGFTPQ